MISSKVYPNHSEKLSDEINPPDSVSGPLSSKMTANGEHIINYPKREITGSAYRELLAVDFGIYGEEASERLGHLRDLSHEGVAILIEKINSELQGSHESLIENEKVVHLRGVVDGAIPTIPLEHRYRVFTGLIDMIKGASNSINPARVADVLALGVVLLHPFKDGNGRTARVIGLTFRDGYSQDEFLDDFRQVAESRDRVRERGGFMVDGYAPNSIAGVNQSDPDKVLGYLQSLLLEESEGAYIGPFGQAPLRST